MMVLQIGFLSEWNTFYFFGGLNWSQVWYKYAVSLPGGMLAEILHGEGRRWERRARPTPNGLRPISLLRLSLPRFVDSNFPGNSLWTRASHPLRLRFCLGQNLRNPES